MQLHSQMKCEEQMNFTLYLQSLGGKHLRATQKIVNEFKQAAFEYLMVKSVPQDRWITESLKLYVEKFKYEVATGSLRKRQLTETKVALKKYFQFLTLNGFVLDDWSDVLNHQTREKRARDESVPAKKKAKKIFYINGRKKKDYVNNQIFREYMEKLRQENSSCIEEHYNMIAYFLRFLRDIGITDLTSLHYEDIKKYEAHLENRYLLKEIAKSTAYLKLLKLKAFIKYLYSIQLLRYKYEIPQIFKRKEETRDNEYVTNEERLALIEAVTRSPSRHITRNIAIILIFVDIGCRPIELCNLKISDVNITESNLRLYSRKSGQRTLKIDKFVMSQLKKYLEIRRNLPASTDHLFLLETGHPMSTKAVGGMIHENNIRAFGESRFSAKSLRHTYITNALHDRNDINQVAESAGHKHLVSTLHYLYRSIETLLDNTLPYNPVEGIDLSR